MAVHGVVLNLFSTGTTLLWIGLQMLRSRSTVEILEYSKNIVIRLYREIGGAHWMVMAL
jgi:hypothetical protein